MALGASASITLHHTDADQADKVITSAVAEISRLEALFSLYRPDSAIVKLNEQGSLDSPDPEFLAVLSVADAVFKATDGAFDPTVQALWADLAVLHATGMPEREELQEASRRAGGRIGFDLVNVSSDRIAFTRSDMSLTLNGIAQGYITDRVTDLLRTAGLKNILVHMGETRAVGAREDGTPWRVGIASSAPPGRTVRTLQLRDRALATSATMGTTFDDGGMVSHIIDPHDRIPTPLRRQISVEAPTAALADALSTAASLMADRHAEAALARFDDCRIVHAV